MIIENKEYKKKIKIDDLYLACHICNKDNGYKLSERILNGIKYKDDDFDYIELAIEDLNDIVIRLIMQYHFQNYLEKNKDKLFNKFLEEEFVKFFKMNEENFEQKYFNQIEEIKEMESVDNE